MSYDGGNFINQSSPHVVSVYRGIRLRKRSDFDNNYGLFQDHLGTIYVASDPNFPIEGYASPQEDKPVGILVEYRLPGILVGTTAKGYYGIHTQTLEAFGVNDLSIFVSRIADVPAGAKTVQDINWGQSGN